MLEERADKKAIVMVLEVLKKYSDYDHRMTQKDIEDRIKSEYGMPIARKAIKRNLDKLLDADYPIDFSVKKRLDANGDESEMMTDFYYQHEFEDYELSLLLNSVMCTPYLKQNDAQVIVNKLLDLTSIHFKDKTATMKPVNTAVDANPSYQLNLSILHEAIQNEKKVTFNYYTYGADKKLHAREKDGAVRVYTVSPYRVVDVDGRTYLICNTEGHDGVSNYRVDKMKNAVVSTEQAKPVRETPELAAGLLDLPKYLSEHMHMSFNKPGRVKLQFPNSFANVIIDDFGTGVEISHNDGGTSIASFKIDLDAIATWAMQYTDKVTVLEPQYVVDEIRRRLDEGAKKYAK